MNQMSFALKLIVLLVGIFFQVKAVAINSTVPSLQAVLHALTTKVEQKRVFGNEDDSISVSELPGYTGWPRDSVNSKFDQCFVTRIGKSPAITSLHRFAPLNFFHHTTSTSNREWSLTVACPKWTVPQGKTYLPIPLFYARAYGPAILVGNQKKASWTILNGTQYSTTEISFTIHDAGLYTVEVVLESMFTSNLFTLPETKPDNLNYDGFLLRGFPLFLNVTRSSSSDRRCDTAQSCNISFCRGKDIEADMTSSSGRWIVLGHASNSIRNKTALQENGIDHVAVQANGMDRAIVRSIIVGTFRLAIETEYMPVQCVLAPLKSSVELLDTCLQETGIHYIIIGDSVSGQHFEALSLLLNPRNRVTRVDLREGMFRRFDEVSRNLTRIQQEDSQQPKVVVFNAGIWEISKNCDILLSHLRNYYNISDLDMEGCAGFYRNNFKRLLDLIVSTFTSDLKIFRTTSSGWWRWGNFPVAWPYMDSLQPMIQSPHPVRAFNDIALQVIRESGYDIKVYDMFWTTWGRPDDAKKMFSSSFKGDLVHMGHGLLQTSLRKLITLVADYFGCFHG